MRGWVETKWKTLPGYMPSMVKLMNGSYNFHFISRDDLDKIKAVSWIKGRVFLALHSWYIGFNMLKETEKDKLIWVRFPRFLIEL